MNIPALLVEYLITGGFSIVWVIPLIFLFDFQLKLEYFKHYAVLIGIPITYVLGLMLDMFCGFITSKLNLKSDIRKQINVSFENKFGYLPELDFAKIYIRLYNNDLANEFERSSSRDRIARGVCLNLFLSSIFIPVSCFKTFEIAIAQFILIIMLTCLSFKIWQVCEMRSYRFKLYAFKTVKELKENNNSNGSNQSGT
ncbi:hypothetical protein [Photobacterium sp. R1]